MRELITDEMVEAAAREFHEAVPECSPGSWDVTVERVRNRTRARMVRALEAAAPAIAAAALRRAIDAADEAFAREDIAMTQWGNGYIDGQGAALNSIRNYADELEAGRG